ncbi:AbiH family protein [Clostridium gasigenes]|uniref:AbiH family protein n=1 Tax=Clostridium gasigenes TaxID=94869 RepID=UPI001C0BF32C|nr:AbiH family protein [Clostridium gasigenes]MBU3102571.1 bacteriophage abortive infection AbiH family protein [Clostridium gasigenes]
MNILVIGNGFDLAHGLPTTYADFMGFMYYFKIMNNSEYENKEWVKKVERFKMLNPKVQEYLLSEKVKNKKDKLMNELYSISPKNVWIKHLEKCIKENKLKGKNWIDFEYEISEVIKGLDYTQKYLKERRKKGKEHQIDDMELILKAENFLDLIGEIQGIEFQYNIFYDDFAKEIISLLNEDLNNLIRCLEIYLEYVVGEIDIKQRLPDINEIKKIDKLISFNYTDTFKKVYDENQNVECDYIHGKLNISEDITYNNMVLGIDEYLQGNEKKEELDFIEFKKYFQRIYKKTGCKYKYWLERAKVPKVRVSGERKRNYSSFDNNIYIYGHSLDVTDKDILEELVLFPRTQIRIFYYNKNDYAQKIKNMVALIGQYKLIDSVYGKNPTIIFEEIKK